MDHKCYTAMRVRPPLIYENNLIDFTTACLRLADTQVALRADFMFGTQACQEDVFELMGKKMLEKAIDGEKNVSFVVIGPRGSGKTFTLFGAEGPISNSYATLGIFQRAAALIFNNFKASRAMFAGPTPMLVIQVAFFEMNSYQQVKDLLTNQLISDINLNDPEEKKTKLRYVSCLDARSAIENLQVALSHRQLGQSHHMVAEFAITQPSFQEGIFRSATTTATFYDCGHIRIYENLPSFLGMPMEDHCVVTSLVRAMYGFEAMALDKQLWYSLLSSFREDCSPVVFFCMPPSVERYNESSPYLGLLHILSEIRLKAVTEERDMQHKVDSTSVAESTKSHTQLECIEEVTESEEEIASSDGQISESPVSLDNSLSESDREEGDTKSFQLSDNNFFSSLDIMCVQFNTFVDKFVGSFKAKTSYSPVKDCKQDYSANRRGGMPELPVHQMQTLSLQPTASAPPPEQEVARARRRNEHERHDNKPSQEAQMAQEAQSVVCNMPVTEQCDQLATEDVYKMFLFQERNLKQIMAALRPLMREGDGRMKSVEEAIENALEGVKHILGEMGESLNKRQNDNEVVVQSGSKDFHRIRLHRRSRSCFVVYKHNLNSCVQNKTATDEDIKDQLMADEMIETIDACIEVLSNFYASNPPLEQKFPNTKVGKEATEKLNSLTKQEMKHLMSKYFMKVVDLRENSKHMERTINELDQKLEMSSNKILQMQKTIDEMRRSMLGFGQVLGMSDDPPEAHPPLALAEGLRSRRVPETAKASTIPPQNLNKLQATKAPPPAKVTITHNKLIIEKSKRDKN